MRCEQGAPEQTCPRAWIDAARPGCKRKKFHYYRLLLLPPCLDASMSGCPKTNRPCPLLMKDTLTRRLLLRATSKHMSGCMAPAVRWCHWILRRLYCQGQLADNLPWPGKACHISCTSVKSQHVLQGNREPPRHHPGQNSYKNIPQNIFSCNCFVIIAKESARGHLLRCCCPWCPPLSGKYAREFSH